MAMNKPRLKGALKTKIEQMIRTYVLDGDNTAYPELTEFSEALAEAISDEVITEVQNYAQTAATFSGTFSVIGGGGGSVTITNQPVNGTVS